MATKQSPSANTISLILAAVVAMLYLSNNKGCQSPTPTPAKPSTTRIIASPAMLSACAPVKAAVATADATKRARLATAFDALALALSASGDAVKTTGALTDVIIKFGDVVANTEPDLRAALPLGDTLTKARDTAFASLPGTGVDKAITKSQAADFVAAIAESLR